MQLDLFCPTDVELIRNEVSELKQRSENLRRGLFARHNELSKMYIEAKEELVKQKQEIEELKRLIQHNSSNFH